MKDTFIILRQTLGETVVESLGARINRKIPDREGDGLRGEIDDSTLLLPLQKHRYKLLSHEDHGFDVYIDYLFVILGAVMVKFFYFF